MKLQFDLKVPFQSHPNLTEITSRQMHRGDGCLRT